MPNLWLRLWTDMPTDPKWRTIARVSGQSISVVQAVYLQLLVSGSNAEKRGVTQCNAEDIASALDETSECVEAVLAAMQGRVLEGVALTGWEKRQPKREDNSENRVKEWRERNVTQCNALKRTETLDAEEMQKRGNKKDTLAVTAAPAERGNLLGTLPLNKGEYEVREDDLAIHGEAYPAVDVKQQYREMKSWLIANPTHKKTRSGIKRFMNSWLARAQNSARPATTAQPAKTTKFLDPGAMNAV